MIKSVTVVNDHGDSLKMGIGDPDQSGLLISNIDGISPGQADISTTELAATDGAVYNSARLISRNITMDIILNALPSIEENRYLTYEFFPLKKEISLIFETDNRNLKIDGYVESNEADIFEEQETVSISIICPNPYFYSHGEENTTVFSGIEAMFEFPFCNDSLTEKLLVFGEIRTKYENVVFYEGDAETGFVMNIHFTDPASDISIYNVENREIMKIDTDKITAIVGSAIQAGDDLTISTVRGNKYLKFYRLGQEYNVLNCLDRNSDWLQLYVGINVIAFTAATGNNNLQFSIYNDSLFEGV